jgi:hypothetical protein
MHRTMTQPSLHYSLCLFPNPLRGLVVYEYIFYPVDLRFPKL